MPTGLANILKSLNKEVKKIKGGTRDGVHAAAIFVQGESQETVPQEFGVLINSAFTSVDSVKPIARVGYTAKYAPFVHEMPATNNFTKPGTGPKFLQKAISNNQKTILEIIQNRAKIK